MSTATAVPSSVTSSIISAVGVTAHELLLGSFVVWLCSVVIVGFWSVIVIV